VLSLLLTRRSLPVLRGRREESCGVTKKTKRRGDTSGTRPLVRWAKPIRSGNGGTVAKISHIDTPRNEFVNGIDPAATDPFANLDSLRLGQDFSTALGKRILTTIPVRKPGRQDFIMIRPEPEFRLETFILELKEERDSFLVLPALWQDLANEISPRVIFTCMNRQGVVFLWPVRRPGPDGRLDTWSSSAIAAAQAAMSRWVRVSANMSLGGYDTYEAVGELSQPEWPPLSFPEILRLAFRDRVIDSGSHPVVRRLRGEL
jgi:hypothetical protein